MAEEVKEIVQTQKQQRGGKQQQNRDRNDDDQNNKRSNQNNNNKGGNNRNAGKDNKRERNQDKDSWVYKYHNDQRPVHPRVHVTLETEIPEMPGKDEILKAPNQKEYEEKMAAHDETIAGLRKQKDTLF